MVIQEQPGNYIIKTDRLSYNFTKEFNTLDNIALRVAKGSVYGFLGPNGAGKTTTLRLLLGLLKNQEGSISIFNEDLATNRISILRRIGSLIEQPSLYAHLTAKENLELYRTIYDLDKKRISQCLEMVDLAHTNGKKIKQFSLGMKQRLSIALSLLHEPQLLILDEPTNGLDPNGIIETRELIKKLNTEQGISIIISSHILGEIEKMATDIGIIHKGKMLFQGTLKELQQIKEQKGFLQLDTSDNIKTLELLSSLDAIEKNGLIILPGQSKDQIAQIVRNLISNNIDVYLLQPQLMDLEQIFLDITSGNA
jgi:ABC-2 type transport system ATP-binding protein